MTDLEFEQLISHKNMSSSIPCIRDLIFNYYESAFPLYTPESIDRLTKNYIDKLYHKFVTRKS